MACGHFLSDLLRCDQCTLHSWIIFFTKTICNEFWVKWCKLFFNITSVISRRNLAMILSRVYSMSKSTWWHHRYCGRMSSCAFVWHMSIYPLVCLSVHLSIHPFTNSCLRAKTHPCGNVVSAVITYCLRFVRHDSILDSITDWIHHFHWVFTIAGYCEIHRSLWWV